MTRPELKGLRKFYVLRIGHAGRKLKARLFCLTGDKARDTLKLIMDNGEDQHGDYGKPYVSGYYLDGDKWIAFDNASYRPSCLVEEFYMEKNARTFATDLDASHVSLHDIDIREYEMSRAVTCGFCGKTVRGLDLCGCEESINDARGDF